ncbi:hypothetical protein GUJ93_ZPchr0011g28266 [Zizania palustris]|uniref:Uncharacterized protein n=1 Tax=Zizania palustris TaxID=103762 RepID=A0A8J5WKP9_ZIZPA|nr:hypothetical protein GUJ93_ZPchr0011g28266 [Zizania palustris]
MKNTSYPGLMLLCLALLMCHAIPAQIRGQTINSRRNGPITGVKNVVGDDKIYVDCIRYEAVFCCDRAGGSCWPSRAACRKACPDV